ncbi:hypothetical protein HYX08_05070 [Candidatus Woesearchaeota archaeon]|nr:hypothetical protein [Candidatus Woesearchaeota archaeon]
MTTRKVVYGESFKGYWNEFKGLTKKVMAFLYLPTLLTAYLNPLLQVPAIALQSYIFKKYIDPIKEKPKKEKDQPPYSVALGNVARKAGRGISDAIYGIGKSVGDKLYSPAAKPAPKPGPAAAPAH